jgi:O-antigen ligase
MTTTAVNPVSRTDPVLPPARIPPAQAAIAIGIGLLTVAVVPFWSSSAWVPKEAVLAVLAAAGLPVLVALAFGRRRDVPGSTRLAARLAGAFVVVALISALLSAAPGIAMVGLYQQGTGWVFVAGLAGCWALGTRLGERAQSLLQLLIIFGALANAIIAVLQLTVGLDSFGLPLYSGSLTDGLQANPFEFGALMAAALGLLVSRFMERPREWYLPVAVVMIGAGACGERLPLLLIVGVLAWAVWRALRTEGAKSALRTEGAKSALRTDGATGALRSREPLRRAVGFCVLTIAGLLAGALIADWANGGGSIARVAGSTGEETFGQRLMAWREGLRAFTHHLLIGAGPGQFRSVTSFLFPFSFVKSSPGEVFTDAHNFVVEYLATTGILGTLALLAFLAVILANARGPLVVAAVVLIAIELAEPLNAAVFPVALGALGAAGPLVLRQNAPADAAPALHRRPADAPADAPAPLPSAVRVAVGVFAIVGLLAGALLIVGDGLMLRGQGQFGLAQDKLALGNATTANTLLGAWPDPAQLISETHFFLSLGDHPAQRPQAVHWAEVAVSRDPTNSSLLVMLSSYELVAGQYRAAQQSALEAQKYLPWYPSALNNLGISSYLLGEHAQAHHWFGLSLQVAPNQIPIRSLYNGSCQLQLNQLGMSQITRACSDSRH